MSPIKTMMVIFLILFSVIIFYIYKVHAGSSPAQKKQVSLQENKKNSSVKIPKKTLLPLPKDKKPKRVITKKTGDNVVSGKSGDSTPGENRFALPSIPGTQNNSKVAVTTMKKTDGTKVKINQSEPGDSKTLMAESNLNYIWDQKEPKTNLPNNQDKNNSTPSGSSPVNTSFTSKKSDPSLIHLTYITYQLDKEMGPWEAAVIYCNNGQKVNEVREANKDKLISGDLFPKGCKIKIPANLVTEENDLNNTFLDNNKNKSIEDKVAPIAPEKPKEIYTVKQYTIKEGDKLWNIAELFYKDGTVFKNILVANPGLDPDRLKIKQTITLPVVPGKGPRNISSNTNDN